MHFIDFLLHLICFICWVLKTIYIFSFDYLIPVIGYILPVLTKYLSQLFSLVLRIFFTYIAPCIIQVVNGTTYVFTKVLNGISVASMKIIDSDMNLEYAHAIVMVSILVVLVYFHVTQKIFRLFYESYQILSLYLRFVSNILRMLLVCVRFIYRKVAAFVLCKPTDCKSDDDGNGGKKPSSKRKKERHQTSWKNGINGTTVRSSSNGSAHRLKDE